MEPKKIIWAPKIVEKAHFWRQKFKQDIFEKNPSFVIWLNIGVGQEFWSDHFVTFRISDLIHQT